MRKKQTTILKKWAEEVLLKKYPFIINVWLFGSIAKDTQTKESDCDIMVDVPVDTDLKTCAEICNDKEIRFANLDLKIATENSVEMVGYYGMNEKDIIFWATGEGEHDRLPDIIFDMRLCTPFINIITGEVVDK